MSRIAPDIPELQRVPEAARSVLYVRALIRAMRSPWTLLAGLSMLGMTVSIGVTQGGALSGTGGAILGGVLGAVVSALVFFKLLLPWRARKLLPSLLEQVDLQPFEQARQASHNVTRMIDAYKEREARERKRLP